MGPSPEAATGVETAPEVSDLWVRLVASPLIGVMIPNLSGLIDNSRHSPRSLIASYVYFTFIAFVIWEGNRRIYFRLQRREEWLQRPWRRIALLLTAIAVYTVPTVTLLMWLWQIVSGDPGTRAFAIPTALLATVTCVVVITHAYETVFLLRDWESDRLRRARTEQARLEAELEALGREVDPHFLFNNLNALVHLIEQHSAAAVPFVTALGETYRYVLESRGCRLVSLEAELQALRHHETLARIRFGHRFELAVDIDAGSARHFQLPPAALGELFHNAIKHNDLSTGNPLRMVLRLGEGGLLFENERRRQAAAARSSTGLGLTNLSQRFQLAVGRDIRWGVDGDRFIVWLPLSPTEAALGNPSAGSPGP